MKISSIEEYGLRCLLQIGRQAGGGSLTIPELAKMERISAANVAKMMRILRKNGFVTSTRGQAGGYALSRPAAGIKVGEVLTALGGRLYDPSFCGLHAGIETLCCAHSVDCTIRSLWRGVQGAVDQMLSRVSLADLLGHENAASGFPPPAATLPAVSGPN